MQDILVKMDITDICTSTLGRGQRPFKQPFSSSGIFQNQIMKTRGKLQSTDAGAKQQSGEISGEDAGYHVPKKKGFCNT